MNPQFPFEKYPSVQEGISAEAVRQSAEEFIKKRQEALAFGKGGGRFEEVSSMRIIDAVHDDGKKEEGLEEVNAMIERNIAGIRFSQHLADLLFVYGEKQAERKKIADFWKTIREQLKKLSSEERDGIIHGIQGMVGTFSLLRHLGYDARYARPVEDALMATDAFARHKKFPHIYLLVQVESPGTSRFEADAQMPWFSGRESREIREKRMEKAQKIKAYARALSETYAEQFFPVLLSVPRFEMNDEIDPVTGRPSARILDKFSKDDIIEKAVRQRR